MLKYLIKIPRTGDIKVLLLLKKVCYRKYYIIENGNVERREYVVKSWHRYRNIKLSISINIIDVNRMSLIARLRSPYIVSYPYGAASSGMSHFIRIEMIKILLSKTYR